MSKDNNGGPAFPVLDSNNPKGMSLRDFFATNAPTDEVQEIMFKNISRMAQERITGMTYPVRPTSSLSDDLVAYQLAEFTFYCAVNAAIRYRLADAMLRERLK